MLAPLIGRVARRSSLIGFFKVCQTNTSRVGKEREEKSLDQNMNLSRRQLCEKLERIQGKGNGRSGSTNPAASSSSPGRPFKLSEGEKRRIRENVEKEVAEEKEKKRPDTEKTWRRRSE